MLTDEILSYLPFRMEYLKGSKMFTDVLSHPLETSPDINTVSISPSPDQIPNILKQAHDNAGHMSLKYTLDFLRPTYS